MSVIIDWQLRGDKWNVLNEYMDGKWVGKPCVREVELYYITGSD